MVNPPPCDCCGGTRYDSRGGQYGGPVSVSYFACVKCRASVSILYSGGAGMVCIVNMGELSSVSEADTDTWINKVLIPTWRARRAALKKHEDAEWRAWLAEVFVPAFPDCEVENGSSVRFSELPDEAKAAIVQQFGENISNWGTYRPYPPELQGVVYPPQVPRGLPVWMATSMRGDPNWVLVDYKLSALAVVPRDPILVSNEEFFEGVWNKLEQAVGPLPERVEVKNEYGGLEPWYSFTVGNAVYTVGWRKRVVNVEVARSEPFSVVAIRDLARRDDTTYYADNHWQAEQDTATSVTIHAWNQDKLVEYLTTLISA